VNYRGRAEVAERVCLQTRTHSGFCSLPLANPTLDERAIAQRLGREYMFHVARQRGRSTSTHLAPGMSGREWVRVPQNAAAHVTRQRGRSTSTHLAPGMSGREWVRVPQNAAAHVTRQRGRSTSTHLAPGMSGREWVRVPQNAAAHVTGISAAGPHDRPSARRPRSSSARRLARARTQTKGACGALWGGKSEAATRAKLGL